MRGRATWIVAVLLGACGPVLDGPGELVAAEASGEPEDDDQGDSSSGDDTPGIDGDACFEDADCEGVCFHLLDGLGLCGECNSDATCDGGGCSAPSFVEPFVSSRCNDGSAGSGCETSEVCADGLLCGVVVGGALDLRTCGDCVTDADCGDGLLCAPEYEIRNVTGTRRCVPPRSRLLGEGCDVAGSGDLACASGHCAEAGILFDYGAVGLCGACDGQEDCPGSICVVPDVEIGGDGTTIAHCE